MAQHWGTQLNANLPITFLAPQSYLCSKVSGNSFRFGIQKPWIQRSAKPQAKTVETL